MASYQTEPVLACEINKHLENSIQIPLNIFLSLTSRPYYTTLQKIKPRGKWKFLKEWKIQTLSSNKHISSSTSTEIIQQTMRKEAYLKMTLRWAHSFQFTVDWMLGIFCTKFIIARIAGVVYIHTTKKNITFRGVGNFLLLYLF